MPTISRDANIVTVIDVFTVAPEKQQQLADLIARTNKEVSALSGFTSASLHKSLDGTHVVNYMQWQNQAAFEAMLARPESQQAISVALQIASAVPLEYAVVDVVEPEV